jgi:metal-responsive CopG/Arc/MetJ family transcriptional regulator
MSRMVRTQIHLSDDDVALLDAASRATGASRSELIRRAVRAQYAPRGPRGRTPAERAAAIVAAAGAWKDRAFTGEEYVRAIRSGDMNANLRRLGA